MTDYQPTLVFIIGPPTVGKMKVAIGSPPFGRLVGEIRRRIFEEVA